MPTWLADQIARYDDDTLAAMASRGLLRRARKDLERLTPRIDVDAPSGLRLEFDGHTISIGAGGPSQATCSCPSPTMCQHVLAALLWLQTQVDGATALAPEAAASAALHDAILAIDDATLTAHAGRAGFGWAWHAVDDAEPELDITIIAGRNIEIRLRHPPLTARYLGGPVDAMIIEDAPADPRRVRVAAVLAYRRAVGLPMPPAPADRPAAPPPDRATLRAQVRLALTGAVEVGLAHLASVNADRFTTLAVWAQGVGYHRLATVLRRIADGVELLVARVGAADERRLLEEMAVTYALVAALEAASRVHEPRRLVGEARAAYEEVGRIELLGVGAQRWRAASGYVGLTTVFWSPQRREFLTCGDARPEAMGFDPAARYRAPGPWEGLECPAAASGRCVMLRGARLSAGGRISAASATTATVTPTAELTSRLPALDEWLSMDRSRLVARSLLDPPTPQDDWVVLRPEVFGRPVFVEHEQTVHWVMHDRAGAVLDAEVRFTDATAHLVARLESLAPPAPGTLLVGRIRRSRLGWSVEPMSLIEPSGRVDSLSLDPPPGGGLAPVGRRGSVAAAAVPAAEESTDPAELRSLTAWAERHAERGVGSGPGLATRELAALAAAAERIGIAIFTSVGTTDVAATVLIVRYLTMQLRAMSG